MEPNILDLRQQRCPMTLLLAKRHIAQLNTGDSVNILICDSSSFKDIKSFLLKQDYLCNSTKCDGYYSITVVKETLLHVRNG